MKTMVGLAQAFRCSGSRKSVKREMVSAGLDQGRSP